MKRRTGKENELHEAQDVFKNGPRANVGFWLGNPFHHMKDVFAFSDRFVFFYFLIFAVLLLLGVIACIKTA